MPEEVQPAEVTRLLRAWNEGDATALETLTPLVYDELHRLARRQMLGEREGHLLQPSALVNEAFLRLQGHAPMEWQSRAQFFSLSARLMRQILIDFARAQGAAKRGQRAAHIQLEAMPGLSTPNPGVDPAGLIDLDLALTRLAALDARQAQLVELRFFGGLENAEIAQFLGISESTVAREWRLARAWLYGQLNAS